jgi:TP901 family phage tail tape measure protein
MAVANSAMIRSGGIASRVFAGIGIGVGSAMLLSIREAGRFEQSLNVLGAVVHATGGQFNALQKHALKLGRDITLPGVSANDAAVAMTQLAKAGFNAQQVIAASKGTMQLGTAAQIEYTEAADMTTRALKMFKLPASDAGRVANVLAAGANASTASMTDMAYGLMNAGMGAKMMNVSVEETVGSLAMLVDAGLSGERAGTALNTMFYRLASPTKAAAAMMGELNIKAFDAKGNFRGLQPIIKDFARATADMGDAQQAAMFKTIFGMRANQAMMGLLDKAGKTQKNYTDAVTGTNAAQEIAAARMKGFHGMLEKVSNGVSTLATELGLKMLPWLTETGKRLATWISNLDPEEIATAFGRVFRPIMAGFAGLFSFVKTNADWLAPLLIGVYTATKAFAALQLAMKGVAAIKIASSLGALALIGGPLGVAAASIGAIAAALAALAFAFPGVRTAIANFLSDISMAFSEGGISAVFDVFIQRVKDFFTGTTRTIEVGDKTIILKTRPGIELLLDRLKSEVKGLFIQQDRTVEVGDKTITIKAGTPALQITWGGMWEGLKARVKRGFDEAFEYDSNSAMGKLNAKVLAGLRGLLTSAGNLSRAIGDGIFNKLQAGVSRVGPMVARNMNKILPVLTGIPGIVSGAAQAIGRAIFDGIMSGLGDLAGAIKSKVVGAVSGAYGAVKRFALIDSPSKLFAKGVGAPIGQGIIMGFLDGSRDLPEKMKQKVKEALEKAKQAVVDARSAFSTAFSDLASSMTSAWDKHFSNYKTPAEKLLEQMDIEDKLRSINQGITDAQKELNDAIAKGDQEAIDAANRRMEEALRQKTRFELEGQAKVERALATEIIEAEKYKMDQRLEAMRKEWERYGTTSKIVQQETQALLAEYGIDYRGLGQNFGRALAMGLRDSIGEVTSAAEAVAAAIAAVLKVKSPTDEGPMSDLDKWWTGFAETLVAGIKRNDILGAVTGALGRPGANIGGPALAANAGGGGGATYVLNVTVPVQGHVLTERNLVDVVTKGIRDELGRTPDLLEPRR